jgi:hypothetical protein
MYSCYQASSFTPLVFLAMTRTILSAVLLGVISAAHAQQSTVTIYYPAEASDVRDWDRFQGAIIGSVFLARNPKDPSLAAQANVLTWNLERR